MNCIAKYFRDVWFVRVRFCKYICEYDAVMILSKYLRRMDDRQNQIFPCRFLDAPLLFRMSLWIFSITAAVIFFAIGGHAAVYVFGCVYALIPVLCEYTMYCMRTKSRICLTADGWIIVKYWSYKRKTYPVSEIESVHVVDFDTDIPDKRMKDYMLPVSMGRGGDMVPNQGVLVFFKRSWFKSVRPVFFNMADSESFAAALSRTVSKNC